MHKEIASTLCLMQSGVFHILRQRRNGVPDHEVAATRRWLAFTQFCRFWVVRPLAVPSGISNVLHLRPAALSIVNIHRAPDRLASVRWASASRMDTSCCAYPGSSARRNASEICAVFGRPPGFGLGQPSCVPCLVSLRKMGRRRGRISVEHQSMALQLVTAALRVSRAGSIWTFTLRTFGIAEAGSGYSADARKVAVAGSYTFPRM